MPGRKFIYREQVGRRATVREERLQANHIAVAVARHPEFIPPVSGSFKSVKGAKSEMQVEVEVNML